MNGPSRLLVIGDDAAIAVALESLLNKAHHVVRKPGLPDPRRARALGACDLVIVAHRAADAILVEWLRAVRDAGVDQRILLVASGARARDTAACIMAGADDIVAAACPDGELAARAAALLRRQPTMGHRIRHGPLELDRRSREVRLQGIPLKLRRRSYQVLEALLMRPGGFVHKREIADTTTALDHDASTNAVEQQIRHLRKVLASSEVTIRTKRGLGYTLEVG